ncbi:DUF1206 domain-containing protein [Microbacterium sp. Se5.02b]|uniref:DUF1206 domain-containing protein n=1 Tax=Microbacterium sp. Se5.02b TaxID=2864103 RepID=UPI00215D7838|nr:DUF1206 domain-containing protein [Microbacterium sp. Se5.02b]
MGEADQALRHRTRLPRRRGHGDHLRGGRSCRLGGGVEDPECGRARRSRRRRSARRDRARGGGRRSGVRGRRVHPGIREAPRSAVRSRARRHRDAGSHRVLREGHRRGGDGGVVRGGRRDAGPREGAGLDAALHSLLDLPLGGLVLGAVGAGFAIYGVFCIARARYARM